MFPLPAFVLLLPVAVVVDPLVALTCPNAIAIGLGDESGDDVNDEIYAAEYERRFKKQKKNKFILIDSNPFAVGFLYPIDFINEV